MTGTQLFGDSTGDGGAGRKPQVSPGRCHARGELRFHWRERALALRRAWFAALGQISRSPHESARFMAIREQATAAEFESSLLGLHFPDEPESRFLLEGASPKLLESAERLKTVMRDAGLLQRDLPLRPLFTLPAAMKPAP